jgi:hypothetical protein
MWRRITTTTPSSFREESDSESSWGRCRPWAAFAAPWLQKWFAAQPNLDDRKSRPLAAPVTEWRRPRSRPPRACRRRRGVVPGRTRVLNALDRTVARTHVYDEMSRPTFEKEADAVQVRLVRRSLVTSQPHATAPRPPPTENVDARPASRPSPTFPLWPTDSPSSRPPETAGQPPSPSSTTTSHRPNPRRCFPASHRLPAVALPPNIPNSADDEPKRSFVRRSVTRAPAMAASGTPTRREITGRTVACECMTADPCVPTPCTRPAFVNHATFTFSRADPPSGGRECATEREPHGPGHGVPMTPPSNRRRLLDEPWKVLVRYPGL